jgi:hypothetical protein
MRRCEVESSLSFLSYTSFLSFGQFTTPHLHTKLSSRYFSLRTSGSMAKGASAMS